MPPTRVLIADDSKTIRLRVSKILTTAGFEVLEAANGFEALDQIDREDVHLAIVDIQMPGLDGYGLCQELARQGFTPESLPVLFLTNVDSRALEVLGASLGDYHRKPIVESQLIEVVTRLTNRRDGNPDPTSRANAS